MVFVQYYKKFTELSFCGGWAKKFKLLSDISFDSRFQKIVLSNLLLFSWARYEVDLDDIQ